MTSKPWHWKVPETGPEAVRRLSDTLRVHRLMAACLVQRGVSTEEEARLFLHGSLADLGDPLQMAGAREAAGRLAKAVAARERLLIYGDYDADGVTSVALLTQGLQNLGLSVEYYIPSRLGDGYGLHGQVLEQFAASGGQLVVTVDCGINSFAEMDLAKELGIDLIVTDHHECFPGERSAFAVLNPKQSGCCYPERNLAGVGVAWTLLRALYGMLGLPSAQAAEFLDLVAVGSIADVVPLLGENRILVKAGLEKLKERPLPGLAALARASGLADTALTAMQVAFTLAPRLNAPGRLGDALPSVRALLASAAEADSLALSLDEKNRERQQLEKTILDQARREAAACGDHPALVLWHDDWHPGVVGIVAGRLAGEFGKPSALIAVDGDKGHGSIRSVPGCSLIAALQHCEAHLLRYGGHPEAAGLTVAKENLDAFREAFCQAVAAQEAAEYTAAVAAEAEPAELTLPLVQELASLEPFGQANPEPLFLLRNMAVRSARRVGARKDHLQMRLQNAGAALDAICFRAGDSPVAKGDCVDAVVVPTANSWQGRTSLSLHIRDFCLSPRSSAIHISDNRGTDKDEYLNRLVHERRVLVWVNTKAAKDSLKARFGHRLAVTQLGRDVQNAQYDVLLFYHLPFDKNAVRQLLADVVFDGPPFVCLCYGSEDILLNERIFAATIPAEQTVRQLAACMQGSDSTLTVQALRQALPFPVTQYLVSQAQAVLAEAAAGRAGGWEAIQQNLANSPTYRQCCKYLSAFRSCQQFWQDAPADEIARYLHNNTDLILPEGEEHNEPTTAKRAN